MSKRIIENGCVAQLAEQGPFKSHVGGSIPSAPTIRNYGGGSSVVERLAVTQVVVSSILARRPIPIRSKMKTLKWMWDFGHVFWLITFNILIIILCSFHWGATGFFASFVASIVLLIMISIGMMIYSAFGEHFINWWNNRPWRK